MATATETVGARAQVRNWLREQVEGEPTVSISDLVARGVEAFAGNRAFIKLFVETWLRPVLYEEARQYVRESRGQSVLLGETVMNRGELSRRAQLLQNKWGRWLEHAGDQHIRLMEMTREHLLRAAEERDQHARTNAEYGQLWRSLAADLPPGKRVADLFSGEEIERRLLTIQGRLDAPQD